jgi:hypothetical protein
MRNFLLGCCCGLFVGAIVATVALAPAQSSQPGNPYAPGSFGSESRIYQEMLDRDTDSLLQQQQLDNLREQQWQQNFSRSLERSFDEGLSAGSRKSVGDYVLEGLAENKAKMDRAQEASDAAARARVDRLEREVERMEMQNEIDRLKRGR